MAKNVYLPQTLLNHQTLLLGKGEANFLGFVYLETEAEVAVAAGGGGYFGDRQETVYESVELGGAVGWMLYKIVCLLHVLGGFGGGDFHRANVGFLGEAIGAFLAQFGQKGHEMNEFFTC